MSDTPTPLNTSQHHSTPQDNLRHVPRCSEGTSDKINDTKVAALDVLGQWLPKADAEAKPLLDKFDLQEVMSGLCRFV